MKTIYCIVTFLLLLCNTVAAGAPEDIQLPVTVRVEVDKNPAFIGDRIRYVIEVKSKKEIEVKFPSFAENLAGLTIRDFGSSEGGFWGSKTRTQWYVLDTYETGTFIIPGATIKFRTENTEQWEETISDEITIEVKSLLESSDGPADIRDIKPPMPLSNPLYLYIGLALIALIIAAALIILYLKKRKKSKEKVAPLVPAHEIAFKAFNGLAGKDYLRTGRTREYYFELSDIVRRYLENRFYLKAPEMTTDEFLSNLENTDLLRSEHKSLLRDFLSHCDMVKFARYHPEETETTSSYESAKELVEQTKKEDEGAGKS